MTRLVECCNCKLLSVVLNVAPSAEPYLQYQSESTECTFRDRSCLTRRLRLWTEAAVQTGKANVEYVHHWKRTCLRMSISSCWDTDVDGVPSVAVLVIAGVRGGGGRLEPPAAASCSPTESKHANATGLLNTETVSVQIKQ